MARRSTEAVGSIAWCDELSEVGAGKREGWLSDPSILLALHPRFIAVARARNNACPVLIIPWSRHRSSSSKPVKIRPAVGSDDGEITAMEWIHSGDILALALATSAGFLMIYSTDGQLIHKQILHSGRVLRLIFREIWKSNSSQDAGMVSGELCVVMPGVVARVDGSDIQNMLQRCSQEEDSSSWDHKIHDQDVDDLDAFVRVPFQLWNVSKYGSCTDAAIIGLMPPPLLQLQSTQRHFGAVTIGDDAVISAYRLSEDRSRSLVGAILSKVMPATFSTLASVSKMVWRSQQSPPKKSHPPSQPFAKVSPLTCLKDPPRKGEKITLSPTGTLAAITDSLGRVLLLDTQALVVVRLWKGYRDASCLFVEMLVNKDGASSSSPLYGRTKNDYCLCLAIHAPRKEIVEIWKMRTGPRLLTIPCPRGSRILQPTTRLASSSGSSYLPIEVFILNGDSGELSVLNRSIR